MINDIPNPEDVDEQAAANNEKAAAIDNILNKAKEAPEQGVVTSGSMQLDEYNLEDTEVEKEAYDNTMRETGAGAPDPPEPSDLPYNKAYDSKPIDEGHDEAIDMFSATYNFGTVTVDAEEKERFLRSALNDSPMYFDIKLPGVDRLIKVYQPNTREHACAVDAVNIMMDDEVIKQPNRWLVLLQRLYMHLQIEKVGDDNLSTYDREEPRTQKELEEYLSLRETTAYLERMQKPRYDLLLLAMKVAERKNKLCSDGLMSADFFGTASTD